MLEYDDTDLIPRMAVLDIIENTETLAGSPFDALGFWGALGTLFRVYMRPFFSLRVAAHGTKEDIYQAVLDYKRQF